MKKYIIIPFLFVAVNLFSQPINQQTPPADQTQQIHQPPMQQGQGMTPYNNSMNSYGNKAAKYRKMKVNGIVLASVGGAGLIGGLALLTTGLSNKTAATNNYNGYNQAPLRSYVPEIFVGGVFTVVGALALTGGTVMAIIGNKKEKDYAMANHKLTVIVAPTAFRIAYTF
ncbi:MAG TPA: hypothetical protein VN698_07010 [Bacteroidia bacterium]|nr:hypothetical protein [Bacteroidia bacterium]